MAILSRDDLKERIENGEILDPETVSRPVDEMLEYSSITLSVDTDWNRISNTTYATGVDSRREDHRAKPVPKSKFKIPKRELAVLTSAETIDMPGDLVGRVGVRFSASQQGLIKLFGPQVEPGYQDRFYAVLYNASSEPYDLNEFNGEILRLEVRTLSSPISDDELGNDKRADENSIPQELELPTDPPNTKELEHRLIENEAAVGEVRNGYSQIVLFGVFLLATAAFGVVLPQMIEAATTVQIGANVPTLVLTGFGAAWLVVVYVIVQASRETVKRQPIHDSLR